MHKLQYIIAGLISSTIGIIIIYNRKSILDLTLKAHKDIGDFLQKKKDLHNNARFKFLPNLIVILIGMGLLLMGMLSALMVL